MSLLMTRRGCVQLPQGSYYLCQKKFPDFSAKTYHFPWLLRLRNILFSLTGSEKDIIFPDLLWSGYINSEKEHNSHHCNNHIMFGKQGYNILLYVISNDCNHILHSKIPIRGVIVIVLRGSESHCPTKQLFSYFIKRVRCPCLPK